MLVANPGRCRGERGRECCSGVVFSGSASIVVTVQQKWGDCVEVA